MSPILTKWRLMLADSSYQVIRHMNITNSEDPIRFTTSHEVDLSRDITERKMV